MTSTILETKLHIPKSRSKLVNRPHLIDKLNDREGRKLALVSAPAGYGKTTLISQWSSTSSEPFAWLSLDENDNDLVRFAQYLTAALAKIRSDMVTHMQEMLQLSSANVGRALSDSLLMTWLINDVVAAGTSFVLVLDDYQVIQDRSVNEALKLLLERMPTNMFLVIITREDPALSLSTLRGRGELIELRESDLRFDSSEIAMYFEYTADLKLSQENVSLMQGRTEGWIVGIQLSAIAIKGRRDKDAFIHSFSGDNRYIMDYLLDEILNRQSKEVQFFILTISVLSRFSREICSALTDGQISSSRCQDILEYLEQANLFVIPLDSRRRWYRFHHLMGQALYHQLSLKQPEKLLDLNLRASRWFEENGYYQDAVDYALKTGDISRTAQLIEVCVPRMAYLGQLDVVAQWLEELPDETIKSSPWLNMAHAWILFRAGDLNALRLAVNDTESSLVEAQQIVNSQIAGQLAILKGTVAGINGEMEEAVEHLGQAVFNLPEQDIVARSHGQLILASCLSWLGEFEWAMSVYSRALRGSQKANHYGVMIDTLGDRARLESWMGRIRQAERTCLEALQISSNHYKEYGWQLPETGYIFVKYSTILCERDERQSALDFVHQGIELCEKWGQRELLIRSYIDAAQVLTKVGELDEALSFALRGVRLAEALTPWYVLRASAAAAALQLALGNFDPAANWFKANVAIFFEKPKFVMVDVYLALARMLTSTKIQDIFNHDITNPVQLYEDLLSYLDGLGATGYVIETRILQALYLHSRRQTKLALVTLTKALELAAPEGYLRVFAREGDPMMLMLKQLAVSGYQPEYIGKLLSSLASDLKTQTSIQFDPLTERELEVLRLIAAGLTNQEIAGELFISLGTVKTHINHIYSKLDTRSRTQATARAQELKLI